MKKIVTVTIMLAALMLTAGTILKKERPGVRRQWIAEPLTESANKLGFGGLQSSTFDQSANGAGWYLPYNRKVQANYDPVTGPMVGAFYRQLNADYGTGTIGGMIGVWDASFEGYAQTVYSNSLYQTGDVNPGGRYPFAIEFINGYFFGVFNDFDVPPQDDTISQPMFAVCDATFGWDLSMWSTPKRIESTEGGAVIPGAWQGNGDAVYNPEDGYYYLTSSWLMDGLNNDWNFMKLPFVTGRSNTPADPDSWEWTDYSEVVMDCSDRENGFLNLYGDIQIAYAKDIYGNGTGFAIAVTPYVDVTYEKTNLAGEPLDVSSHERLGYMYTTNWGADWTTGDFKSNWITPNMEGNNFIPADVDKLFDWYNTILTGDSIGVDSLTNETIYEQIPMNWPNILANVDVICTEENIVHVLCKVMGGSTESDYLYYYNDEKMVSGYYDIVGKITESGVTWMSANRIADWMGIPDGTEEFEWSNVHELSIGYAGYGVVYASWWDRPETRYTLIEDMYPTFTDRYTLYIDDAFFSYSADHGKTWSYDKTVTMANDLNPEMPYVLKYAHNITKSGTIHDEGWSVARHGTNVAPGDNDGTMKVYAACQYYIPDAAIEGTSYTDYQQNLKLWQITGTGTGIETEDVSMVKDFTLYQNYPNPFNPTTEIRFALQNDSNVKLAIYNTKGELVSNLKNEKMTKGVHNVSFDATSYNSGVYFYKLDVNGRTETRKMVLTK